MALINFPSKFERALRNPEKLATEEDKRRARLVSLSDAEAGKLTLIEQYDRIRILREIEGERHMVKIKRDAEPQMAKPRPWRDRKVW